MVTEQVRTGLGTPQATPVPAWSAQTRRAHSGPHTAAGGAGTRALRLQPPQGAQRRLWEGWGGLIGSPKPLVVAPAERGLIFFGEGGIARGRPVGLHQPQSRLWFGVPPLLKTLSAFLQER